MKNSKKMKTGYIHVRGFLWNLLLISAGSALCGLALNGILIPQKFISSGFAGLSLIIHYFYPAAPVGVLYFALNIPLFLLGWKHVGRRFFFCRTAHLYGWIQNIVLFWTAGKTPVYNGA